jgi:hemerythrin superfamily protein
MKATELLKSQHKEVKALFGKLEKLDEADDPTTLFEELAAKLVGHDAIEREIFYPACEEALGEADILNESLVEHGVVEFSLYQADRAIGGETFKAKCTVLQEIVEHHVEEEEKDLFPKVEAAMEASTLEELGAQLQARFEQAQEQDFRAPLRENLRRVLLGATKLDGDEADDEDTEVTTPASERKPAGRATSAKGGARATTKNSSGAGRRS